MADLSVTATNLVTGTGKEKVVTKLETPRKLNFAYEIGSTLQDAINLFGEGAVYGLYTRGITVAAQNVARVALESGASDEEVLKVVGNWKPGSTSPRARVAKPVTADNTLELFAKMTPEQQADFLQKLKALRGQGK